MNSLQDGDFLAAFIALREGISQTVYRVEQAASPEERLEALHAAVEMLPTVLEDIKKLPVPESVNYFMARDTYQQAMTSYLAASRDFIAFLDNGDRDAATRGLDEMKKAGDLFGKTGELLATPET